MASAAGLIFSNNLRSWFGWKGFVMVLAAALVPLILTGAWIFTHQADVEASDVSWNPDPLTAGDQVTFTATFRNAGGGGAGDFNASLSIGRVIQTPQGATLSAENTTQERITGLGGGQTRDLAVGWTARAGIWVVLADADPEDEVGEKEELNNQKIEVVVVRHTEPDPSDAPAAPGSLTGNASSPTTVDVSVDGLSWSPAAPAPGDNVTLSATVTNHGANRVENVSVTLRAGTVVNNAMVPSRTTSEMFALDPGQTQRVELAWNNVASVAAWAEAYANVTSDQRDTDAANNHQARTFVVQPSLPDDFALPEPPDRLTIKLFYIDILSLLHIRILLPLIALFYAGGALADEREKGNLTYILVRPVNRWALPLAKFASGFLVAAAAVILGLVATYVALLGTPQGADVGWLSTPILVSLITLLVYGGFFSLLGVLVNRPYLIGVAFVIGWETVAFNFVPWVQGFTLTHHLVKAIGEWRLDQGLQWLPGTDAGVEALRNVVLAGIVFVVAAAVVMKRREFDA